MEIPKKTYEIIGFLAAVFFFAAFAVYLYQPHFERFTAFTYLVIVNSFLASSGCFLLSRRWITHWDASFFAGLIYGFSSFLLGYAKFHPTAGLVPAILPWLFLPVTFTAKTKPLWYKIPLCLLPFLFVFITSWLFSHWKLFVLPIRTTLRPSDLIGLLDPLVMIKHNLFAIGFYHVTLATLIIGCRMLIAARRFAIMLIITSALVLSFCNPILNISPISWIAIAVLGFAVIIGSGIEGLSLASSSDRKWVLAAAIVSAVCSIVTLLLATHYYEWLAGFGKGYGGLFAQTAKMYLLGTIAVALIFIIILLKLRLGLLRRLILIAALGIDIFLGAKFIVDTIL